jgi:hypothetical protein
MRSRSVAVAIGVAVLCAGGAVGCYVRAQQLRGEAAWLMARGNAEAQDYAASLDSATAANQLKTFEQRRAVLERAHLWQRGQMLLTLSSVAAVIASYVLFLFRRLREQLVDASAGLSDEDDTEEHPVRGALA